MARYWIYLNGKVEGPYGVEQLIRLRGFSRQSQICVDDASGQPQNWISPSELPELAHIFKAVDERQADVPTPPRPPIRRVSPLPRASTPAVVLKRSHKPNVTLWGCVALAVFLLGGGGLAWHVQSRRTAHVAIQRTVQSMIETLRLPSSSAFNSISHYTQEKRISPRWEFDKKEEGLYHVSVTWYSTPSGASKESLTVYAFEVNTQAQTVRAINSAASRLMSEGFTTTRSASPSPKTVTPPKPAPVSFDSTMGKYLEALGAGDFQATWGQFSKRKRSEMMRAGISKEGYMRLQSLTHRLETNAKTSLEKSKKESDTETLVLLKQTQAGRPDVFIKQFWVQEEGQWKLDDEQKKSAAAPETPSAGPTPVTPTERPVPTSLPGMSN
jgi:hypothetical protein